MANCSDCTVSFLLGSVADRSLKRATTIAIAVIWIAMNRTHRGLYTVLSRTEVREQLD